MALSLRQTSGLLSAERALGRTLPRVHGVIARQGVSYEKAVMQALAACAEGLGAKFRPQPWYTFEDESGWGQIVPDGLFTFGTKALVIEVKRTWVPEAATKLTGLYVPVVELAERVLQVHPLVICRALTPDVGVCIDTLSAALSAKSVPTLLWLGRGRIEW